MKNLKKAELSVIALTLLCLFFTAGYFVGRGSAVQVVSINKLTAEPAVVMASPVIVKESGDLDTTVPDVSPPPSPDPGASASIPSPSNEKKININTASSHKLEELPGIGPVLAQSIINYREKIGGFTVITQIMDVDGIGEKKFNAMKDMISVG